MSFITASSALLLTGLVIGGYAVPTNSASLLDCSKVQFYLATRNDPQGQEKSCLEQNEPLFRGQFNATNPIKILVHGWKNSKFTDFTVNLTKAYLNASDVNVIQVDWSAYANLNYFTARAKVVDVGRTLATFVARFIDEFPVNLSDIHIVGHSLGAHAGGVAGYQFSSPKIGTVTGLDPAGPLFWFTGEDGSISTASAEFVVILHTCGGLLGTLGPIGDVDFFANGGIPRQPGCTDWLGFCSHDRSVELFAESLGDPTGFEGTECSNYIFYLFGLCSANKKAYLAENVDRSASGNYYFETSSSFPYALN